MECPALHALAPGPRQDVPGITLSSVNLKNLKNRSLGTMPIEAKLERRRTMDGQDLCQ